MVLCYLTTIQDVFLEAILGVKWDAFLDANWDINWDVYWDDTCDSNWTLIEMLIIVQNSANF